MSRRVVLWVIPVGDLGGVARHALDVARESIPGWDIVFLVPDGTIATALLALGATVDVAAIGPKVGVKTSLRALRQALKRWQPAVVHTHLAYADLLGAITKPTCGTALVTTEHGIADDDLIYHRSSAKSAVSARMHRLRLQRVDSFIAVAEATLEVARRKWALRPGLPARVIYNGIDRPATVEPEAGLHVVSLARFAPEKRLDSLVRGFATLSRTHPEATLTLAGIGPLREQTESQVAALGLSGRVSFPGYVDAAELLQRAHVLAQLSVFENCSYSLLDAVVHGVGVVASPVGGNPEILPTECLVDPHDADSVAAHLAVQGLDLDRRPTLDPRWPTVAEMTADIAKVYEAVAP